MNHLDLCSGIGGFSLAAHWAGYTTIGFCEIDPWCRRVLAKNFPGVPQHDDLKTLTAGTVRGWIGAGKGSAMVADSEGIARRSASRSEGEAGTGDSSGDSSKFRYALDLITGGYPCQPFSLAGKRLGAEDDRHLWPFIAAMVADLKPRRCLFENVYGHVSMGLDAVLSDLEALGYACGAVVVPACAVGAPHRRDRVWILADAERSGGRELLRTDAAQGALSPALETQGASRTRSGGEAVSDAASGRQQGPWSRQYASDPTADSQREAGRVVDGDSTGEGTETLSGMGQSFDGLPGRLAQWTVGPERRDPWAGDWEAGCPRVTEREADRTHKLKALGNAIVPQVAYEILRCWEAA